MARRKRSGSRAHARHSTALATRPSVVVVRSGGGGKRRRRSGGGGVVRYARARRVGRSVGSHALHATGLATGGAILGYLQGAGHLDWVPEIMGSKTIGLALVGYGATRVVKNKYVREAAAAAVAGFEFGREHGSGGKASTHGWNIRGSGGGVGPFGGA
jgi:hypothetical protein